MAIKAIAFRIVVKPDAIEDETINFGGQEVPVKKVEGHWQTPSGVVVDHIVDEKLEMGACVTGIILDIGEDAWAAYKPKTIYAGLQVGDHIAFAKYAGKWVPDPETKEEVLVLNDEDVVCKVKGN